MNRIGSALRLLREAFAAWNRDNAPRLGAALSYYTLFSLAPLLVIAIAVAGLVFGRQAAEGRIVAELSGLIGQPGGAALQGMIENGRQLKSGILAGTIALATLALGASGVFAELKGALNVVWNVQPPAGAGGVRGYLRERLLSLVMVLVVGFLLIVSLLASTLIAAAQSFFSGWLPQWQTLVAAANEITSFAIITLLFALIFKFLPDTPIAWRDVWVGAALTSLLFTIGKGLDREAVQQGRRMTCQRLRRRDDPAAAAAPARARAAPPRATAAGGLRARAGRARSNRQPAARQRAAVGRPRACARRRGRRVLARASSRRDAPARAARAAPCAPRRRTRSRC